MNENNSEKKSIFDVFPSRAAFWTGFVAGIMALCTVGFILIMAFKMDWRALSLTGGLGSWGNKPVANANANTANTNANTNAAANLLDNLPPITKDDHVRGDLNKAKVVMIEYSDFECPYCKRFDPTIQQVFKDYKGDVAWVYRHFPLTSIHQNAQKEAEASECVAELGGNDVFWKFLDAIYTRTDAGGTGFALDKLGPLAKELGVDQKKFQSCLDSDKYASVVQTDEQGGEAAGITGTPGTIVLNRNGQSQLIVGAESVANVKKAIDALLK